MCRVRALGSRAAGEKMGAPWRQGGAAEGRALVPENVQEWMGKEEFDGLFDG